MNAHSGRLPLRKRSGDLFALPDTKFCRCSTSAIKRCDMFVYGGYLFPASSEQQSHFPGYLRGNTYLSENLGGYASVLSLSQDVLNQKRRDRGGMPDGVAIATFGLGLEGVGEGPYGGMQGRLVGRVVGRRRAGNIVGHRSSFVSNYGRTRKAPAACQDNERTRLNDCVIAESGEVAAPVADYSPDRSARSRDALSINWPVLALHGAGRSFWRAAL